MWQSLKLNFFRGVELGFDLVSAFRAAVLVEVAFSLLGRLNSGSESISLTVSARPILGSTHGCAASL